jgi:hypothetical protein
MYITAQLHWCLSPLKTTAELKTHNYFSNMSKKWGKQRRFIFKCDSKKDWSLLIVGFQVGGGLEWSKAQV